MLFKNMNAFLFLNYTSINWDFSIDSRNPQIYKFVGFVNEFP